jgi:hypothetical protein
MLKTEFLDNFICLKIKFWSIKAQNGIFGQKPVVSTEILKVQIGGRHSSRACVCSSWCF